MKRNMTSPIIEAKKVGKSVTTPQGLLPILTEVSLKIMPGESIAILGASGSGKSTLLGLLAGLDLPSQGDCYLNHIKISQLDEDQRAAVRAQHVGFVFQSFNLIASLTALENVSLPLELANVKDASDQARRLLDRVGLNDRLTHYPNQLSGGEQQRVAIARAFANTPSILFADEPTGNLDQQTGEKIIDLMFNLNREQQTTLVLVTHDNTLASRCQRQIKLETGKVIS